MNNHSGKIDLFEQIRTYSFGSLRVQDQIDSNNPIRSDFESRVPVCTSYILASLQYQNEIANYHQHIMEMCLSIFESAQPTTMQNLFNLDIGLIALLWMPVEFVGDYMTQRLCIKLIVAVLKHLSVEERQQQMVQAHLNQDITKMILNLAVNPLNFEKVSRKILNKYNLHLTENCTVFSIYCTKAVFGTSELFKPNQIDNFWIDFNSTSRSVSLLCQLNQNEGNQEEFYIKIKINKLRIENQFDCSVSTTGPAFFSTEVSAQLLSSRVALFTLPENQLKRLKTNYELFTYFNGFTLSQSSEASTPDTITKYLDEFIQFSPMTPYSEKCTENPRTNKDDNIPKIKLAVVRLHKFDAAQTKDQSNVPERNQNTNKQTVGNSATTDRTTLVSHIELIPNYVGPSIQETDTSSDTCSNSTTAEDTAVFKKPKIPIKYRSKRKVKPIPRPIKPLNETYLAEKSSALEDLNILPRKAMNTVEEKIPDFTHSPRNNIDQEGFQPEPAVKSGKEQEEFEDFSPEQTVKSGKEQEESEDFSPEPTVKSGKEQKESEDFSPEPTVKSGKEQEESVRNSKLTKIQVSKKRLIQRFSNANGYPVKHQRLIEKHSFEISFQEVSNISKSADIHPNVKTNAEKSVCNNDIALLQTSSCENPLQLESNQLETSEILATSTPIQVPVNPIQKPTEMMKSSETSQCDACAEPPQQFSNNTYINRSSILNQNTPQNLDDENHVTSTSPTSNHQSQTCSQNITSSKIQSKPKRVSKSVKNKKPSDATTLHSLNSNSKTPNLNNVSTQQGTSTTRRFFKNKHLPNIFSRTSIKSKRNTGKKKISTTDNNLKTKSVNLVKPLNFVNLNKIEPVESRENKNSLNKRKEMSQNLITISDTEEVLTPKTPKRRQKKQKALLKDCVVRDIVSYSVWKSNQKKKKSNDDSIMFSPSPKKQNKKKPETKPLHVKLDPLEKVKHFGVQNESIVHSPSNIAPSSLRSCSSSNSIHSSNPDNELQSAQDPLPVKNTETNNGGDSIMFSTSTEHQKENRSETEPPQNSIDPFDKLKYFGIQNENIPCSENKGTPRSRRRSSSSDSNHTCYFSESEDEMQSAQYSRPVRNKRAVRQLSTEIIRRDQRDDMISSPITVPIEITHKGGTKSASRETDLSPLQMSLVSDTLDYLGDLKSPDDSRRLLQNTTMNYVSPIYEDLDDEVPEDPIDTNQPPKVYNPLIEIDISVENDTEPKEVPLMPKKMPFVKSLLQQITDERPTSSQGSTISVFSELETSEPVNNNTNQVTPRNNQVLTSIRKRAHCVEVGQSTSAKMMASSNSIPLKDYDRLLPQFAKKLKTEKDRLLNNIETKINEDNNDHFTKTVNVISKTIEYHQTAIKEERIKLVSILENLDSHYKILQKNQSELEKMHCQILERLEVCDEDAEKKIDELYKEAEESLKSYADVVKRDQWHNFSKGIINSINTRLTGYLDI